MDIFFLFTLVLALPYITVQTIPLLICTAIVEILSRKDSSRVRFRRMFITYYGLRFLVCLLYVLVLSLLSLIIDDISDLFFDIASSDGFSALMPLVILVDLPLVPIICAFIAVVEKKGTLLVLVGLVAISSLVWVFALSVFSVDFLGSF